MIQCRVLYKHLVSEKGERGRNTARNHFSVNNSGSPALTICFVKMENFKPNLKRRAELRHVNTPDHNGPVLHFVCFFLLSLSFPPHSVPMSPLHIANMCLL